MPAEFDSCRKRGGRIRTKRIDKDRYMHICFIDGKSYPGEVRMYKKLPKKTKWLEWNL